MKNKARTAKKKNEKRESHVGAFFDLDHTLLRTNSGILWGWIIFKKGKMPFRFFLNAAILGPFYKIGLLSFRFIMKRMFKGIKGKDAGKILKITRTYFRKNMNELFRPKMLQRIGWHKAQGHKIIIITQTFDFIAKMFAKDLGAIEVYSTE
ncbi:haloacid dehalogenase-like hydrolase, partial [Candidatus Woesearchaeota archaeon]|nr:haloacid dehalogenase-like hydrolase [Candidatus Woesearchaeota archaeon]